MAGLFSQLYWPKLLKYLPRLLLHTFNDKYISVCVCVCLALDFIAACPAHFSHSLLLHLCGTKERSSWRLDCYAMSRLYRVSYFRLFLSSLLKQQKQRRKTTSGVRRGGGGAKVYGTMAPTVSPELPLPKRISCLSSLLYWFSCLKFSCSQGQYNGCNSM